jgi:hypothetical protein
VYFGAPVFFLTQERVVGTQGERKLRAAHTIGFNSQLRHNETVPCCMHFKIHFMHEVEAHEYTQYQQRIGGTWQDCSYSYT